MIGFLRSVRTLRALWPGAVAASLVVFLLAPAEVTAAPLSPTPPAAAVDAAATSVRADLPEVVVLTLGDSNSVAGLNGGWQAEFCRQLSIAAGKACDLRNASVGGTGCGYWPSRVGALLAQHQPDLVILACGTNDDLTVPGATDALGTAFRLTVEAVHTFRTPAIPIVPVLMQYSDPYLAPPWVLASTPAVNDELYRNILLYNWAGWFPGIVDWQIIPATAYYLLAGGAEVGVHRTARAQVDAGRIAYDRTAPGMSWPVSPEPPPCGMVGHRRGYERPQVPLCTLGVTS